MCASMMSSLTTGPRFTPHEETLQLSGQIDVNEDTSLHDFRAVALTHNAPELLAKSCS